MPQISKRDQILEHGLDLMHRRGYEATSVADIAAASDAPKGSFYNHFASKEDFARELLGAYFADVKQTFLEETGDAGRSAADRLLGYFKRLRAYNKKFGYARGCLLGNMSAESAAMGDETRQLTDTMLRQWRGLLAELINEGQRKGELAKSMAPEVLGAMLLDSWQGALLRAKAERKSHALDIFIESLLPALLTSPHGR